MDSSVWAAAATGLATVLAALVSVSRPPQSTRRLAALAEAVARLDGGTPEAKREAYDALLGAIARQANPRKRELRFFPAVVMIVVAALGAFFAYAATNAAIARYQETSVNGYEIDATGLVILAIMIALATIALTLVLGRYAYVDTDAPRFGGVLLAPVLAGTAGQKGGRASAVPGDLPAPSPAPGGDAGR